MLVLIFQWLSIGLLLFNTQLYAVWQYSTYHTPAAPPSIEFDTCFMAVDSRVSNMAMGPSPVLAVPRPGALFISGMMVGSRCIAISPQAYADLRWHGSSAQSVSNFGLYDQYENQIRPSSQLADPSTLTCVACKGDHCIAATNTGLCLTAPVSPGEENLVWVNANADDCKKFISNFGEGGGIVSMNSTVGYWGEACLPSGKLAPSCKAGTLTCVNPKPICDSNGTCRGCSIDSECPSGQICENGSCIDPHCTSNDQCSNPTTPICEAGRCRACSSNSECGSGNKCVSGSCEAKKLMLCP